MKQALKKANKGVIFVFNVMTFVAEDVFLMRRDIDWRKRFIYAKNAVVNSDKSCSLPAYVSGPTHQGAHIGQLS